MSEGLLQKIRSLVDAEIAYLQRLARNNDLSSHGTGKLSAYMRLRDLMAEPVEKDGE
jgi:hypothetical protein